MSRPGAGFEPPTTLVIAKYAIQLSYTGGSEANFTHGWLVWPRLSGYDLSQPIIPARLHAESAHALD